MKTGELPSVEVLRERILRRIMRVACVAGVFGMLAGVAFVRPLDVAALAIAVVATVVVFGLTMLPEQRRLVSTVYPWALVIVGVHRIADAQPRAACHAPGLALGCRIGRVFLSNKVWTEELRSTWVSASTTMLAVVAPAAIAGRMLISVLAQALAQRESLVKRLVQESDER